MRDDFSSRTINALSRRAGFRCSNPDCRRLTVGSNEIKDKSTLVGVGAHITAASPGGARYNSTLTSDERCSIDNGIWLCANCSTLIDKDEKKFPVDILNKWKAGIEKETADELRNNKRVAAPIEEVIVKETFTEKAERVKEIRKKQLERDTFLRSPQAIEEARNQVSILIAKLKERKAALEDPSTGFNLGMISRREEMYGFGHERKYICFNWCRPEAYDINVAMLIAVLMERTGVWEFDMKEIVEKRTQYKYTRSPDGEDGWVDFETGENFISSDDLVDKWFDDFLVYINYA